MCGSAIAQVSQFLHNIEARLYGVVRLFNIKVSHQAIAQQFIDFSALIQNDPATDLKIGVQDQEHIFDCTFFAYGGIGDNIGKKDNLFYPDRDNAKWVNAVVEYFQDGGLRLLFYNRMRFRNGLQ